MPKPRVNYVTEASEMQVSSWHADLYFMKHKNKYIFYHLSIRSSDNDSTGFWPPGSLHTLGADGQI